MSGKSGGRVFLSLSLALLLSCSLAPSCSLLLSLLREYTHCLSHHRHHYRRRRLPPSYNPLYLSLVEVFWDGALSQRFFHMPDICKHLAVSTRKRLVRDIYRGDADLKLIDFLNRAKVLTAAVVSSSYTAWHCMHCKSIRYGIPGEEAVCRS